MLTSITIPDSVIDISGSAFSGCTSLETVYYGGTEEQWNAITNDSSDSTLITAACYYYSETNPFEGGSAVAEDNFWHYAADGTTPIIWTKDSTEA